MTKFTLFRLKNEMLFANFIANAVGVMIVIFLTYSSMYQGATEAFRLASKIGFIYDPIWSILIFLLILYYERPIRKFLNTAARAESVSAEITIKARQRLLNEPFFLIALDLGLWFFAAVFYASAFWFSDAGWVVVYVSFSQCLLTGLITSVTAFFLLRSVLQRRIVPYFFPTGGLYMTPNTLRIRISSRLAALILAGNIVPFISIIVIVTATYHSSLEPFLILEHLRSNIVVNSVIFIIVGILLTILVSFNLRQPFKNIIRALQSVRNGNFDKKVRVTSNDEIGYTGDVVNEMTEGLKERDRMRQSLELAKEVQQNFIPRADPEVAGLDIAGRSQYCDRTGGDYYDYLEIGNPQEGKIGVVIGDVSGHGIPSALLMASARSSLRQRAQAGGAASEIISDVNRQLTADVEESGSFMTLFYSDIDSRKHRINWVRAGHDPAIFYDPQTDSFEELKGAGMALGVDENWKYEHNQRTGLKKGQIIVLATDGIWEAHNVIGEMFGKDAFHDIIRRKSHETASRILESVFEALAQFQEGVEPEDDVTLVVIKIVGNG
jgi:sigma-B regulation protein RsbU (phosphoserine phosphatase)